MRAQGVKMPENTQAVLVTGTRLAILSASPAIIEFIGTSDSPRRVPLIQAILFADQKER